MFKKKLHLILMRWLALQIFGLIQCNWTHKLNSQFLNIVRVDRYLKIHIRKNMLLRKLNFI